MEPHKAYFSLRETEQQTGLPASTLRYWEGVYPELSPRKDGHGNRYYTPEDIDLLRRIKYLRDEMHITHPEAIRAELHANKRNTDSRARAYEILTRLRAELVNIRRHL